MIPYCILVIEDDDDREFMTLLYIRYQRLLYKEIYEILKKPWNTEDILQATLVKLIDKIPELRQKERPQLVGYICAAARNTALNFLRAQDKIAPFSFEEYMMQSEPNEERRQMEEYMISKDEIDELVRRWPQLDDRSKMLLEGKLPLTIGGGIGQSRLCMLLLGKAHIGQVQASVWDAETRSACEKAGVVLL